MAFLVTGSSDPLREELCPFLRQQGRVVRDINQKP